MARLFVMPAGVRLDAWPADSTPRPDYSPEILSLRDELRRSVPELATQLDMLEKMRQIRELVGSVTGPVRSNLIAERG